MKKLILSVLIIGLFGCGNEPKQQEVVASAPTMQNTMSNDEAKKFAENLYEKIKTEENTARTAYKNNDKTKMTELESGLQTYILGDGQNKGYWIDDPALDPYTKCDTAIRNLYIYVGAMKMELMKHTKSLKAITNQEEQDYLKSKAKCENLVVLSYDEASQQ